MLLDFKRYRIFPHHGFGHKILTAKRYEIEPVVYQPKNRAREIQRRYEEKTNRKQVQTKNILVTIITKWIVGILY